MDTINQILLQAKDYLQELPPKPVASPLPEGSSIAAWIDHTLLKSEATSGQIEKLCQEAVDFNFASVCINPVYVRQAANLLNGTRVKVCTVIGFPLGASLTGTKVFETQACIQAGANEIDMVLSIGGLKNAAYDQVRDDILGVVEAAHACEAIVKVILETSALERKEKIIACLLCENAGADFVKTSTGFGTGGATIEDVELMFRVSNPTVEVKASGGIRTLTNALAMIEAGASRLGTSAGVRIMNEATNGLGTTL